MPGAITRPLSWGLLFVLSLLGGIISSFLFGTSLYPGIPNSAIQDAVTLEWAGEVLEAKAGVGSTNEGYLYLQLDASGRGFIPLPVANVEAATYRFLVIDTDWGRHLKGTALIWQTTEAISPVFKQPKPSLSPMRQAGLPLNGWMGAWLDLSAQPHWTGTVANLGLALAGEPGTMVRIEKVSLLPDSLGSQVAWLLASWASHAPWSQRSLNFYKGEAGHPPFETVTVYRGGENQVSQAFRVVIVLAFTSASLILCENADPGVRRDLESFLSQLAPDGDPRFEHSDEGPDDMPAHIRAILTKVDLTLPVLGGRCALGTWQGIYLYEHRARPHTRHLVVTVCGE